MTRPLALMAVALLATGCATRASYHRLTADVATLRGEVTDLRQAQETSGRDLARTSAEARALEAKLTELNGAQTAAANEVTTLRERVEKAEAELREARAQAAAAIPAPAPAPRPVTPPAAERPPESAPRESAARESAQHAYQAAMATFRARQTWDRVVKDYPKSAAATKARALMRSKATAGR